MAVYQRILFQKARETSVYNYKERKTHRSESTASEGRTIKDFYESVIATGQQSGTSETSCSDVKPKKKIKNPARNVNKRKRSTRRTANSFLKAAAEGDLKVAKEYVEQNCDINIKDDFSWTALMCACCSGQVEMTVYLLNHGAEWIGTKDKSGADAKILAQRAGHIHIVNLLENNGNYCNTTESNDNDEETHEPFYCISCNTNIEASTLKEHNNSTVHQFSMQHTQQSTMYYLNDDNKGYQMMLKGGWDSEKGLGPDGSGMKFPVKTILKRDRHCLGSGSKSKESRPRITHFKPFDTSAVKRQRKDKKHDESVHKQSKGSSKSGKIKTNNRLRKWEIEFRQSWNNSETS